MSRACPIELEAARLYFKHMGLDSNAYSFMWGQCSEEYKNAWRLIAKAGTTP